MGKGVEGVGTKQTAEKALNNIASSLFYEIFYEINTRETCSQIVSFKFLLHISLTWRFLSPSYTQKCAKDECTNNIYYTGFHCAHLAFDFLPGRGFCYIYVFFYFRGKDFLVVVLFRALLLVFFFFFLFPFSIVLSLLFPVFSYPISVILSLFFFLSLCFSLSVSFSFFLYLLIFSLSLSLLS